MAGSTAAYRTANATVSSYDAFAITPNDSTDIKTTRAIYVGGSGNLKVDMAYGTTVTFNNLTAGTILPVQVTRVYSTGTTATLLVGML